MSWQACDAVDRIPHDACGGLEFRVLLKLANVSNAEGKAAFISKVTIANGLGISQRSVQRAFKLLEMERLITKGDQRHVAHIRADKRPTVYDINMDKCLNWTRYHGETELSTIDPHGETSGETTAVAHKELIELTIKELKTSNRGSVSPSKNRCSPDHHNYLESGYCAQCGIRDDEVKPKASA